jgi:putative FmdB family regulatory protein
MPIYEYRCGACGHHLEALQKMTDSPLRKCPECGKSQLKRLVSASQFRLKGSGWYETDFKNDKEKKRNLVETASAESSDAPSDKPAAEPAKADAGKSAATAAGDGEKAKPAKPTSVKPAAKKPVARSKPAVKPRAKVARG